MWLHKWPRGTYFTVKSNLILLTLNGIQQVNEAFKVNFFWLYQLENLEFRTYGSKFDAKHKIMHFNENFWSKLCIFGSFLNEHKLIDMIYTGKCYFQDIFIRTYINIIIIHWYSKCASSSFTVSLNLCQHGTWDGCDQPWIALSNQLMGSGYLYECKYSSS